MSSVLLHHFHCIILGPLVNISLESPDIREVCLFVCCTTSNPERSCVRVRSNRHDRCRRRRECGWARHDLKTYEVSFGKSGGFLENRPMIVVRVKWLFFDSTVSVDGYRRVGHPLSPPKSYVRQTKVSNTTRIDDTTIVVSNVKSRFPYLVGWCEYFMVLPSCYLPRNNSRVRLLHWYCSSRVSSTSDVPVFCTGSRDTELWRLECSGTL